MARRAFQNPLSEALATDHRLYARFVDMWRREGHRPLGLNELAWHWDTAPMSEAKVAVTMKAMVAQGYARRVSPRVEQATWEPIGKALNTWPESGVAVMPDAVTTEIAPGVTVSSDPGGDDVGGDVQKPQRGLPRET